MSDHRFNQWLLWGALSGVLMAVSMPLGAEFALNFKPFGSTAGGSNGGGGWGGGGTSGGFSNVECGGSSTGSSGNSGWGGSFGGSSSGFSIGHGCGNGYFLQEVANDGTFHVIVGDPAENFALEWHIRGSSNLVTGYLPNVDNPLGPSMSQTGNGAGNPTQVHFRQLVKEGGMQQETVKALNARKPKIAQSINDGALSSLFTADMTNSSYSQQFTGQITNVQTISASAGSPETFSFDLSKDAQQSSITAGKYTHPGGEFKSYSYASGGFDVSKVKWIDFCDPKQNTDHKCNLGGSGNNNGGWSSGGGGWGGGGW